MSITSAAESNDQPANTISPQLTAGRPRRPFNCPQTDKTIPKLTKIATSNPTISRKTLNFLPISTPENKLASKSSLQPFRQSARQPTQAIESQHRRTQSNRIEQTRTRRTVNNRRDILPSADKITPKADRITPRLAKSDHFCPPRTNDLLKNTGFRLDPAPQKKSCRNTLLQLPTARPRLTAIHRLG